MPASMLRFVPAILFAAGVAGCNAPPEIVLASSPAYSPEWCNATKALAQNSGSNLFAVGRCHELGIAGFPKEENLYLFYYAQSARWGNLQGSEALARLGQPVPYADLQAEARDRAEQRRAMDTMAAAMRSPAPPGPPRQAPWPAMPSIGAPRLPSPTPMAGPPAMSRAPSFGMPGSSQTQGRTSTQSRNECTNGVCRTVTTTCTNGVCSTTSQ